jgi:Glycosyltransferase family 92
LSSIKTSFSDSTEYLWENGTKLPQLVTCPAPFHDKMPVAISLTASACDNAENKLQIIDNQPPNGVKKGFGLCSKTLTFDDRNYIIRFIEWMEIQKILGVDKITTFDRRLHPDFYKILQHYQNRGDLEITKMHAPSNVNNTPLFSIQSQMLEMMQLTDCFYRTRNLYDYIAVMDTDEVIVPMRSEDYTLHDLIKRYDMTRGLKSFMSHNAVLLDLGKPSHPGVPTYHYMLQKTEVSSNS